MSIIESLVERVQTIELRRTNQEIDGRINSLFMAVINVLDGDVSGDSREKADLLFSELRKNIGSLCKPAVMESSRSKVQNKLLELVMKPEPEVTQ